MWTCVHDIQSGPSTEFEISGDADEEDSDDIESELINPRWHPPSTTAQTISRRRPPPSSVHAVQASSTSQRQPHRPNLVSVGISPQSYADVWVAEISMHHRFDGNFDNAVIYGINSGISAAQAMALMQQSSSDENRNERGSNLAESQLSCDLVPQQVPETHASLPRRRRPREREEFDRDNVQPIVPPGIGAALLKKIEMNTKHMLYYVQEPNKGRGFIKELCFSHDGRIICSPYDRGVRLLAFNDNCLELSETLEPNGMPKQLVDLMQTENHSDIVISSKFSPREPLLVSGCLQGELVWYKPVL